MAVGFKVGCYWFQVGTSDFCIPFFQRYVFGSNMENGEVFIPN